MWFDPTALRMDKIDIEFKPSSTGMYSPWHLDIARKYNVNLIVTSDTGQFVKIGEDVYKIRNKMYELYKYITTLEEMNNDGDITDEETLKEIDDIINNRNKEFYLEKCKPLDEFEKEIENMKRKQIKQKQT